MTVQEKRQGGHPVMAPDDAALRSLARKAALAEEILKTIRSRRLTRAAAAGLLGIDGPDVAQLQRRQLDGLPEDLLLQWMARLGRNVTIVIGPRKRRGTGRIELDLHAAEEAPVRAHNRSW